MSTPLFPTPNGTGDLNGMIRDAQRRVVTNTGPDQGRSVGRVTVRGFSPETQALLERVEAGALAVPVTGIGTNSAGSLRWMWGRSAWGGPDQFGVA